MRIRAGVRRRAAGWALLSADYSQVELRILAHLAHEPALDRGVPRAARTSTRATAAEVFGIDAGAVTPEQRARAKAINFGIIYGMGAFGLAQPASASRSSEARAFIDAYFERYPGVRASSTRRSRARGARAVSRRSRPAPLPAGPRRRATARCARTPKRIAMNTRDPGHGGRPHQAGDGRASTAAARPRRRRRAMILTCTTSWSSRRRPPRPRRWRRWVKEEMEGAERLDAPLLVEVGWGADWYEAKGG